MPPNTLRVHTEYVLVKSMGPKVVWAESRVQGTGKYFPPIQFQGKIVEVEIGGGAIHRPFGEFLRAKSYYHLVSGKKLILNKALNLLQNLPSENSDALIDDSSDE
ncbi:uncharacterized protein TNCV_270121 [Trichonephila clavipes]|nr:uncharacterized protein TNCV_270121 [Trichonephila clavipes]